MEINLNSKALTIISLYKPPNIEISQAKWRCFFLQFPDNFVVGGDFNSHHLLWGDSNPCPEGRKLADVIIELCLYCLNNGSSTRFATSYSRESAIDLTISNSVASLTAHWEVM